MNVASQAPPPVDPPAIDDYNDPVIAVDTAHRMLAHPEVTFSQRAMRSIVSGLMAEIKRLRAAGGTET